MYARRIRHPLARQLSEPIPSRGSIPHCDALSFYVVLDVPYGRIHVAMDIKRSRRLLAVGAPGCGVLELIKGPG